MSSLFKFSGVDGMSSDVSGEVRTEVFFSTDIDNVLAVPAVLGSMPPKEERRSVGDGI
tara:strand:+ start:974 stop:1147 length:174 start_codon:yes stop_codon:yes gene_type:complete